MNKQILRLAIPNILSNLSVPLLGAVNTALVGRLPEIHYLGAVALGVTLCNLIYWGFIFIRMGTTGLTAQSYGREDHEQIILILCRACLTAAALGSLAILFKGVIIQSGFYFVHGSETVEYYAREYFSISIFAAPAVLCLYAFQGWFLGMQNAQYPLIVAVFTNLLNILINLTLIKIFDMRSSAIAVGTVISQYLGLLLAFYLYRRTYHTKMPKVKRAELLAWTELKKFFTVNRDIFIRTVSLMLIFTFFNFKSAQINDATLAANTILLELWIMFAFGLDGLAFAAESLVGKYFGARDTSNLRKVTLYMFRWGIGIGFITSLIYSLAGANILQIFTDKTEIIALAKIYLPWTMIAPVINSICFVWDGVFIGATATAAMRNSMLLCAFGAFFPTYWTTFKTLGNHSLWLALTIFMAMRGISMTLFAQKKIFGAHS